MAKTKSKINLPNGIKPEDLKEKLAHEKSTAIKYQKRRHDNWNETYELFRDIVRVNRLTQRQAINIPLMKETIRTMGSKINEITDIHLTDRGGSPDKDIVANQIWQTALENNNMVILDRVDKKQEMLYGRSHMSLNIDNTKDIPITIGVEDIYELLVDPKTKPHDIETARYLVKTEIYKPLQEILTSERYDRTAVAELREKMSKKKKGGKTPKWYQNQQKKKNERLEALGIDDVESLEGYEQIVALDGHFTLLWDKKAKEFVRYYVIVANEDVILSADTLKKTIGVNFYPFEGWADDVEITDYWSDGVGDLIRVPNKTINMWISQHMENRTLRSFGMNFYNSKIKGFKPQTFQPKPFGWYPLPGNPKEVYQRVDIPPLEGTLNDVQFITQIAERASAMGAIEKGAVEDVKRTLGEIEIAVANAQERTNDIQPIYQNKDKRLATKFFAMLEANMPEGKKIPLYKKAYDGSIAKKEVTRKDWVSEEGYEIEAGSARQRLVEKTDEIVRMKAVKQEFPENPPLNKAIQKRMVGLIDLTPNEIEEIQEYERQKIEAIAKGQQEVVPQEIQPTAQALQQEAQSLAGQPPQQ